VDVVELAAHHRAQDAAPAVRRVHAHDRDAGRRDGGARYGHVERERTGAADDRPAVARGQHPADVEVPDELRCLLGRRVPAEVLTDDRDRLDELGDVLDGLDLRGGHARRVRRCAPGGDQSRSSGA
jgi:hypothetical protein